MSNQLEPNNLPADGLDSLTSELSAVSDLPGELAPVNNELIHPSSEPTELGYLGEAFHPIAAYRDQFAPNYHRNAQQLFGTMVQQAQIDVDANEVLNLRIDKVSAELQAGQKVLTKFTTGRVFTILGAVAAGLSPLLVNAIVQNQHQYLLPIGWVITIVGALGLTGLAAWGAVKLTEKIKPLRQQVNADAAEKDKYITKARAGLAPLANTYHWNMLDPLVEQSLPGIQLDPYVASSRENDLYTSYGLVNPVSPDSSVVATQSGSFNGNPFVILQTLNYQMGTKRYTGSLVITWVEMQTYTDSNGRLRTRPVTRTQTLVASVVKPCPEYWPDALMIMGTEATPELSFSRSPSKLSALEGKRAERRVNRTVKKLEKQARNTSDGNTFTVTANQDFDALFHAVDRNDEVQFRVLFTPAAQQQMVDLMREKQHGFGDNFEFRKSGPIVTVRPQHLVGKDVTAVPVPPPDSSEHWNLAHQQTGFTSRANAQFRDLYHALAPALAIPLLHEPRESPEPEFNHQPSSWEAEANANFRAAELTHPESITENIRKAIPVAGDPNQFQIVSSGFRGIDRVDFVPTLGGDGRIHPVPVPWVEYQPVHQTFTMQLQDATENPTTGLYRRGLTSTIN